MNPILTQTLVEAIARAQHILLMTDERIDGDTMGSTLGLYHVLIAQNKRALVYSPKPAKQTFAYLPGTAVIRRDSDIFLQHDIDLIIVCDCSDGAYLPPLIATMPNKPPMIVFDHHATNPRYGTINVIEPESASTADVVWRFVQAAGYTVNADAAQCLLTGIITDTQVFFSANTTHAAVEAAAELSALGADLHAIVRHNFVNKSPTSLKLWGIAMERLFVDEAFGGIATALTKKDLEDHQATSEDIEGISNFLNAMLDERHDVIVVYRETDDGAVKGSARSRITNVAAIAERLYGGGGHIHAAGFKVPNARLEQTQKGWKITPIRNGDFDNTTSR